MSSVMGAFNLTQIFQGRRVSRIGTHGCCCSQLCFESYDIVLNDPCVIDDGASYTPKCPPNLLTCMLKGKKSVEISANCPQYSAALRTWGAYHRDGGINGPAVVANHFSDTECATPIGTVSNFAVAWIPGMWVVEDPDDPKFGWYRVVILWQVYGSYGIAFAGEAQYPEDGFDNLLPSLLVDWCDQIATLPQIATGGWVMITPFRHASTCSTSACRKPASVLVTLDDFNVNAPGCVPIVVGVMDSADDVVISGVDGAHEVPWVSDDGSYSPPAWIYQLEISGSGSEANLYPVPACAGPPAPVSDAVLIQVTMQDDYLRTSSINISGCTANLFTAGNCFNQTYTNTTSTSIMQGAGTAIVERVDP